MQYSTLIAALAIGAPVFAMPAPNAPTQGKFTVSQTASGKVFKNGPMAYRRALAKYNAPIPQHVASAAAAAQSGSVTATPEQYDSEYLCPVTIGSGQTVNLDFDTGSADLWVFSTELPSDQSTGHTLYDPSSASALSGATWQITYGDGSGASGNVYADQVVVGPVTATSQAVEAATSVASSFTQSNNDGLLGLAFSSINTVTPNQQTTFFDTVAPTLDQPLFAAYLRAGEAGSYDFGFTDSSKYTGSLNTVSVDNSNGFWAFDAGDASVGGSSIGSVGSSIADTGTTLVLIDDSIVSGYYANVDGASNSQAAGGWVFSCDATLPDFTLTINGVDAVVPGAYINYAPNGDGTCYGGIQSSSGIGFNILGDVFLKSQYVVFSNDGPSLAFAPQA